MFKKILYTTLVLLLSLGFIFINTKGLDVILDYQEHRFLSEQGTMKYEMPVSNIETLMEETEKEDRDGNKNNKDNDSKKKISVSDNRQSADSSGDVIMESDESGEVNKEGYTMTSNEVHDVLECLGNIHSEMIHEPMDGQISMIEAINVANEWLDKMGISIFGTELYGEYKSYINASLVAYNSSEYDYQPYFSFWVVVYEGDTMSVTLYINAITGKVWRGILNSSSTDVNRAVVSELDEFVKLSGIEDIFPVIRDNRVAGVAISEAENSASEKEYEDKKKESAIMYKEKMIADGSRNGTSMYGVKDIADLYNWELTIDRSSVWAYRIITDEDEEYSVEASVSYMVQNNGDNYYGNKAFSVVGGEGVIVFNIMNRL